MVQRVNPRQRPGYEDLNGSDIHADPRLQFAREDVVHDITKNVEKVVNIKKDNFDVKKDKIVTYLLIAATVALVAIGIVLIAVHGMTGIGTLVAGIGLAVGFVACFLWDKTLSKEEKKNDYNAVHQDAMDRRVEKVIQKAQDEDEGIELQPLRYRRRERLEGRHDGQYVPRRLRNQERVDNEATNF